MHRFKAQTTDPQPVFVTHTKLSSNKYIRNIDCGFLAPHIYYIRFKFIGKPSL